MILINKFIAKYNTWNQLRKLESAREFRFNKIVIMIYRRHIYHVETLFFPKFELNIFEINSRGIYQHAHGGYGIRIDFKRDADDCVIKQEIQVAFPGRRLAGV